MDKKELDRMENFEKLLYKNGCGYSRICNSFPYECACVLYGEEYNKDKYEQVKESFMKERLQMEKQLKIEGLL